MTKLMIFKIYKKKLKREKYESLATDPEESDFESFCEDEEAWIEMKGIAESQIRVVEKDDCERSYFFLISMIKRNHDLIYILSNKDLLEKNFARLF